MSRILWSISAVLLLTAVFVIGCQPAKPYSARTVKGKPGARDVKVDSPEKSLPEEFAWMDPGPATIAKDDVRIEFVHHGTSPEEWKKLPGYWNDPSVAQAVGVLGLSGLGKAAVAANKDAPIKIKVPLGLDDPLAYIPATNPPTKAKWNLGRKLFFDPGWLTASGDMSCATCHRPDSAFTDGQPRIKGSYNVPTLVNVVYQSHQFWDGRLGYLEGIAQQSLADEREPDRTPTFDHRWYGIIGRLRKSEKWRDEFNKVFGVAPTQDTVGKALATYLRTLLAGDSLHDRAVAHSGGRPTAAHYEKVLDDKALEHLGRAKEAKSKIAKELARGHDLFRDKAGCASCHPLSNGLYSDGRFYNIGVESEKIDRDKRANLGRFSWAPYGEKTRYLIGAYKVPTLRSLTRTSPYFHDGSALGLVSAIRAHVKPSPDKPFNLYLDPRLAGPNGEHRDLGLNEQEIADLVQFLRALDGSEVDRSMWAVAN